MNAMDITNEEFTRIKRGLFHLLSVTEPSVRTTKDPIRQLSKAHGVVERHERLVEAFEKVCEAIVQNSKNKDSWIDLSLVLHRMSLERAGWDKAGMDAFDELTRGRGKVDK